MDTEQDKNLQKLLRGVAGGDASAFQALYETTSARLYAVALKMLHGNAAADDVLQDAFVQVWHRAGDYHGERGSVLAWLTSIVRYRAIDALRKRRRDVPYDDSQVGLLGADLENLKSEESETEGSERSAGPLGSAMAADDSRCLARCLARLSESQQQSITLAFFHGMTHAELAASLALPLGTIKSRVRRSLQRLKECLAEIGFGNEISA